MATRSYRVILTVDIEIDGVEDDWESIESALEDSLEWDAQHFLNASWVEEAVIESFDISY